MKQYIKNLWSKATSKKKEMKNSINISGISTSKIHINGQDYVGRNIIISGSKIIVDGKEQEFEKAPKIEIYLAEGSTVEKISGADITVHGDVHGKVNGNTIHVGGDAHKKVDGNTITVKGDILGDVDANTVTARDIKGDVDANTVTANMVATDIDAKRSKETSYNKNIVNASVNCKGNFHVGDK